MNALKKFNGHECSRRMLALYDAGTIKTRDFCRVMFSNAYRACAGALRTFVVFPIVAGGKCSNDVVEVWPHTRQIPLCLAGGRMRLIVTYKRWVLIKPDEPV